MFQHVFSVTDTAAQYVLVFANGSTSGASAVKSATVTLNGQIIVAESDVHAGPNPIRKIIQLLPTNTIVIASKGVSGAATTVTLRRRADEGLCGPKIFFDQPAPDSTVYGTKVVVTGTASGTKDVGVTVNGVPGVVNIEPAGTPSDPFRWCAIVPGTDGPMTLTATATTSNGSKGTDVEHITFYTASDGIHFGANRSAGTSPLDVAFQLTAADPTSITRYEFDLDGDGQYELSSVTRPDGVSHRYPEPGLYLAHARVTTTTGVQFVETIPINVQSLATINGIITASWSSFLDRLTAGDIESALAMMADDATRQRYRRPLTLIRGALPVFAAGISGFHLEHIGSKTAHYLATRIENGRAVGYHIYFAVGPDGVWRLLQF
jgi:hypothetical protein